MPNPKPLRPDPSSSRPHMGSGRLCDLSRGLCQQPPGGPPSLRLPPLWFELHKSAPGSVRVPPNAETCVGSPVTQDGVRTLESPSTAQPISPASSGREHPALPHAILLPASLPAFLYWGLWNKVCSRSGFSFLLFSLEDPSSPFRLSTKVTFSEKKSSCPPLPRCQGMFSAPLRL